MSLNVAVIAPKAATVEQLATLLEATGHRVVARGVVANRRAELGAQLKTWIEDPAIELVIGVVSAAARAALVSLITKRLVGFTDLREIDGGRCDSTIVILVSARAISREILDKILPRVTRELRGPRSGPTQPPPRRSGASIPPTRHTPTTPPPFHAPRAGSKTRPPPLPVNPPPDIPDFIETHERSPEADFEEAIAAISPARLEPLPVVVSPIARPARTGRRPTWIAVGIAAMAGAVVGGVMAWKERGTSETPVAPQTLTIEHAAGDTPTPPPVASDEPSESSEPETIEMPPIPIRTTRTRTRPAAGEANPSAQPTSDAVPSAAQVWDGKAVEPRCDPIWCAVDNFERPCCQAYKQPAPDSPPSDVP